MSHDYPLKLAALENLARFVCVCVCVERYIRTVSQMAKSLSIPSVIMLTYQSQISVPNHILLHSSFDLFDHKHYLYRITLLSVSIHQMMRDE